MEVPQGHHSFTDEFSMKCQPSLACVFGVATSRMFSMAAAARQHDVKPTIFGVSWPVDFVELGVHEKSPGCLLMILLAIFGFGGYILRD